MRWVYISPHLDDAVLSAGGLIHDQARAGHKVEIWTCMCGFPPYSQLSPLAQRLHLQWGTTTPGETVRLRRAEDHRAASAVGAKTVHFDFLDCIYRRGPSAEWLYEDVFIPPVDVEGDLPERIAGTISARLKPDDKLVCQLSVGSHVDHVTVRRACELLDRPLLYDVDIPYLFNHSEELAPKSAGMKEKLEAVSETGLRAWRAAISAYASQISTVFESEQDMHEKIRSYWAKHGGIGLWSFD
jgi:LmbE family N-acetylglucosaminyl deacetylase